MLLSIIHMSVGVDTDNIWRPIVTDLKAGWGAAVTAPGPRPGTATEPSEIPLLRWVAASMREQLALLRASAVLPRRCLASGPAHEWF